MADYGAIYTDKTIEDLDRKLKSVYKEAQKDIEERMKEFTERYEKKEAAYAKLVSEGKMTEKEFDRWKQGQVFQGKQWQAKREEIAGVLHNSNKLASSIVNEKQNPVFMTNANYASYQMEHDTGVNFGFGLYDKNTVIRLIKDEPNLLPNYQPKKAKDMRWNEKKITRQVTQGIIQGESLDRISKRLALVTSSQNMNSMKTHARTVMTGAQNAGRLESYKNAQSKGIDLEKEWMATLDSHTRDSHADIDGERVPVDAKFSNGLMYPGEAGGAPEEVYNCRCTMVGDIKKYPSKYDRYDNLNGKRIDNMSYKEWENERGVKKSPENYPKKIQEGRITEVKSIDPNLFKNSKTQNGNYAYELAKDTSDVSHEEEHSFILKDGNNAAFANIWEDATELEVTTMGSTGGGTGTEIFTSMMERAEEKGLGFTWMADHKSAMNYYSKLGLDSYIEKKYSSNTHKRYRIPTSELNNLIKKLKK